MQMKSKHIIMDSKTPFNKDNGTKIPFEQLVELIGTTCDYKFCIVDETIDDELMALAAKHGIDLTGYKHVIETSGVQHSEKRHGPKSNDRSPLTIEDYLLVPYIIKHRDKLSISTSKTRQRESTVLVYEKQIDLDFYYVEEIRSGKKSLAFQTLYKRATKNPSFRGV